MQKYFLCSFFFVLVLDNDVRPVGFDFFIGMNRHVPEDIHFLFLFLVYACTTCPPVDVVNFADIRVGVRGGLYLFRAATCNVIDGFFTAVAYYYDYDYEYMTMI